MKTLNDPGSDGMIRKEGKEKKEDWNVYDGSVAAEARAGHSCDRRVVQTFR